MPVLFVDHITSAYESLHSNRLRTGLTVLGVTIGIGSTTVILALSSGASHIITNQINQLGNTIAVVRPSSTNHGPQLTDLTASLSGSNVTSSLTEQDVTSIQEIHNVKAVAPLMFIGGSITAGNNTPSDSTLIATTSSLARIASLPIDEGQFIDETTDENTAVVGSQLSINLFGTTESIGKLFHTHGSTFRVIGILSPLNNPVNYDNVDYDNAAIIKLDSGKSFNQGVATLQQIDIRVSSQNLLPSVLAQANKRLSHNHHNEKDFSILSGNDLARPANELFSTVAITLSAIAAISIVVGGIGIMNIMLVDVNERTREIGIRKALGASNVHIVSQFLIEALMMGLVSGIFGYLSGYIVAFLIARTFLTFNPVFSWPIAAFALCMAIAVGLVFGLYPAIRAARKNPIEALRQYN